MHAAFRYRLDKSFRYLVRCLVPSLSKRWTMRRRQFITLLGGAAVAWPLATHAQQKRIPRVGVLWHAGSPEQEGANFTSVVNGFRDLGYIDGQNVKLEHRFPNEQPDQFKSMVAELASTTNILITVGNNAAPYARDAA